MQVSVGDNSSGNIVDLVLQAEDVYDLQSILASDRAGYDDDLLSACLFCDFDTGHSLSCPVVKLRQKFDRAVGL